MSELEALRQEYERIQKFKHPEMTKPYIRRLELMNKNLFEVAERYFEGNRELHAENERIKKENIRLCFDCEKYKNTLKFYADKQNWMENLSDRGFYMTAEAIKDDGKRAREALGDKK